MATCPVCEGSFFVDEEEVEEGDVLSCEECGVELEVVSVNPLELEAVEDEEGEEDEEADAEM
jgi:alpha-aminoadipate/glutamate carrier protein LysW